MKKGLAVLATVAMVASAATGVLIWRLSRNPAPGHPEISAYTRGQLVRVGPYRYCNVKDLNDCDVPKTMGQLAVTSRNTVQLSVPFAISKAPWVLLRAYEGPDNTIVEAVCAEVETRGDHTHRRPAPRPAHRHRGGTADLGPRRAGKRVPAAARRVVGKHRVVLTG